MAQDSSFVTGGETGGGGLSTEAQGLLDNFWTKAVDDIKTLGNEAFKSQELPLARIKKIMKLDDDVKVMMISAEAPVLFAKAAEIFITEISLRAWIHTEDNKRRTLQRNDIAMAITKYDQFDFLIDIVPRDELKPAVKRPGQPGLPEMANATGNPSDPVQYYLQMAQQQNALNAVNSQGQIQILQTPNALQGAPGQFAIANQPQMVQVQLQQNTGQATDNGTTVTQNNAVASQGQLILQQQPAANVNHQIMITNPDGGNQLITLTAAQLQQLRQQLANQSATQPIVLQSGPQYQVASNAGGQFIVSGASSNNISQETEQLDEASE
jgi:nuclear transcription factor Y gamma